MRGAGIPSPLCPGSSVGGVSPSSAHPRADLEKDSILKLERVRSRPSNEPNTPRAPHAIGEPRPDPGRTDERSAILSEGRGLDSAVLSAVPNQSDEDQFSKQATDRHAKTNHLELSQDIHITDRDEHGSKQPRPSNYSTKPFDEPAKDAIQPRAQIEKSLMPIHPAQNNDQNEELPIINETGVEGQDGYSNGVEGEPNGSKNDPQDEMIGALHDEHDLQQDAVGAEEEEDEQA